LYCGNEKKINKILNTRALKKVIKLFPGLKYKNDIINIRDKSIFIMIALI